MANHIWVVERSADGGETWELYWNEICEHEQYANQKAIWLNRYDEHGNQFRVRKYIPEPDNG